MIIISHHKMQVQMFIVLVCLEASCCLATTAAVPESTSEPELSTEPESEFGSTSEPEVSTEPESEFGSTSEPEASTKPESEFGSTSEPEVSTEPESEFGSTSEPEASTEPESEFGSTSEPEVKTEPESEFGSTPEPEVKTEPESESGSTSEPEVKTEPESKHEPATVAEPTNAPEPESNPESESESSSEPETAANAEAEQRPQPMEIIGPPLVMIGVLVMGLLILSLYTRRAVIARHIKRIAIGNGRSTSRRPLSPPNKVDPCLVRPVDAIEMSNNIDLDEKIFITDFDLEVLANLGSFNNRPVELLRIASPALLSLFLCPFTLYLYEPLVNLFWTRRPNAVFPPDINEAIACFLAPAGLVYATSFGFAFQQALHKQSETLRRVTHELGLLDQIVSMASKMVSPTLKQKMQIYKAVKTEAIFMALQIENRDQYSFKSRPMEDVRVKIWTMMDTIRNMGQGSSSATFDLDKILADKVISHMLELNSICSDRMGVLHSRIHPLKWAFLESLGFFSFFGILLIRAESYRMELIMCVITVFSISLMCYVVSDLDSPFSGFFKVDVSVLPEVIFRAKRMYDRARLGDNRLCEYPERG